MSITKTRNANHELMRIVSMFFIVLWHVVIYTRLQGVKNESTLFLYNAILFFVVVHVNSYVLLTGYYQSKSTFKQSNLWKIINSNWFYRVVIVLFFLLYKKITIDKIQLCKDLFILPIDNYWFIKFYIVLYCISPFLNHFINSLEKTTFQKLLICSSIFLCILPAMTGGEFFSNDGYSLYNFIFLYLIGAYIRKYPMENNYILKKLSPKAYQLFLIVTVLCFALLNLVTYYCGLKISGINIYLDTISKYINYSSLNYSNPFIMIQSIAYFLFFTTLKINSKWIPKFSKLMLGIYFIHENNYVRKYLYSWLSLNSIRRENISFFIYMLAIAIAIFLVCTVIEWIRQFIFKLIYERKLSKKIREKYYAWLKEIYIKTNNNE